MEGTAEEYFLGVSFSLAAFMGLPLSEYLSTTQYFKSSLLMRVSLYMTRFQDVWYFACAYVNLFDFSPGQLVEFLKKVEPKGPISCDTVLKIFYQTCRAVQHMHKQKPPIIHRDLKVFKCRVFK